MAVWLILLCYAMADNCDWCGGTWWLSLIWFQWEDRFLQCIPSDTCGKTWLISYVFNSWWKYLLTYSKYCRNLLSDHHYRPLWISRLVSLKFLFRNYTEWSISQLTPLCCTHHALRAALPPTTKYCEPGAYDKPFMGKVVLIDLCLTLYFYVLSLLKMKEITVMCVSFFPFTCFLPTLW
jgi:hypothetical protein